MDCDPVTMDDLDAALASTHPSACFITEKYIKWAKEHGAT